MLFRSLQISGIGSTKYWNGYVGEVLIYNKALSDVYRQYIEGYLAWKWGLQNNLPLTHYYYNAAPTQDIMDYNFCIKGASNTVPTKDVSGTYSLTASGTTTMVYDITRGFVFNFNNTTVDTAATSKNGLSLTPVYSTSTSRTVWLKVAPNAYGDSFISPGINCALQSAPLRLTFWVYGGGQSGSINIPDNEWHHYAITISGGTACSLYFDG